MTAAELSAIWSDIDKHSDGIQPLLRFHLASREILSGNMERLTDDVLVVTLTSDHPPLYLPVSGILAIAIEGE